MPTFFIAVGLAIAVMVLLSVGRADTYGLGKWTVLTSLAAGLLVWAAGAKLTNELLSASERHASGTAVVLGFVLAILAIGLWAAVQWARLRSLANCLALPLAAALVVVHLGCFFAGCDYGKPAERGWGVTFTNGTALAWYRTPLGVRLHPTQLYECLLAAITVTVLLVLRRYRGEAEAPVFMAFVTIYACGRFFLEFFRGDAERGFIGPVSVCQWLCLLSIAFLLVLKFQRRSVAGS